MAIKISTDSILNRVKKDGSKFELEEFESIVKGHTDPFKIGNAWIVYTEKNGKNSLNEIATLLFGVPVYGDVLVVPPQQMPEVFQIDEENDYTVDQFDLGFLYNAKETLRVSKSIEEDEDYLYDTDEKVEWLYKPENIIVDENTKMVFIDSWHYLKENNFETLKTERKFYEDDQIYLIASNDHDVDHYLNALLKFFQEEEEYEICAELRDVINNRKIKK